MQVKEYHTNTASTNDVANTYAHACIHTYTHTRPPVTGHRCKQYVILWYDYAKTFIRGQPKMHSIAAFHENYTETSTGE